jgi:PKD repeat protein
MVDNGPGPGLTTFKFACQVNAGAHIFAFSGDNFTYGNQYEVYLVVDAGDSNCFLYVNNGGGWDTQNIFNNTAEANDSPCPAFPCNYDPSMGSFHIGNYCNGTPQEGFTIAKLAVSTNYANVYTFLHAAACSPPTASFTPTSASGPAPLTVNFTDTSVANSGSITTWVWTFGDPLNGTSSSQSPSYTFATPGVYTVNLSVTNSCGDGSASPATATITVLDPFAYWESPSVYNLTGTLTGGNASYTGDGMSNTNKFMAGFSPTSAAAYLHVISIAKSAGTNIVVTYLGANGDSTYVPGIAFRTNVLEFTTGTANGSYATNNFASTGQTNILNGGTGTGTITSFVDTNGAASSPSRYYRVRVLVP